MPNPFDEPEPPSAQATLARLRAELAQRPVPKAALYRVVEVSRDAQGRLVQQGRIWHADLDHARRFGRALAANSVSQRVEVADSNGAVVERLPVPPPGSVAPSGWGGWKDMPLPPAPPRPRRALPPAPVLERPVLVAPASAFGLLDDDPSPRSLPRPAEPRLDDTLLPAPQWPAQAAPAAPAPAPAPADTGVWPAPSTDPLRQAATARALAQDVPSLAARPPLAPPTPSPQRAAPTLPSAATPPTWAVPPHGTVLPAGLPTTLPAARPPVQPASPAASTYTAPGQPAGLAGPAATGPLTGTGRLPGDMAAALADAQGLAAQPATQPPPPAVPTAEAGAAAAPRPAPSAGASRLRARLTGQAPGGGPATLV
ncbi:MAG: hypothetical protein ACK5QH_05590 [Rubrivivax sp.]